MNSRNYPGLNNSKEEFWAGSENTTLAIDKIEGELGGQWDGLRAETTLEFLLKALKSLKIGYQ